MKVAIEIPTALQPTDAWRRLTNWRGHGEWIPLTKMIILHETAASPGLGDKFIGRTGIWPLSFDDVMTVTAFEEPNPVGFCEVKKTGRLVKGSASFEVRPADAGSTVVWVEDIVLPRVMERAFAKPLAAIAKLVFRVALSRALA